MSNRYRRAIKSLRSSDNKRRKLTEDRPTNNTTGLYVIEPDNNEFADLQLVDFGQDDSATDTTGLFDSDGTILTIEPPDELGDHSFILGPMVSQYYAYTSPSWTMIGYVNQSARKAVNLGRITGRLENWDGESGFTSYGQLTIEQARWFRDTYRKDDYYIFYPGPPVGPADEFGRYRCSITGTPKRGRTPGDYGDQDRAGYPWGPLFGPKGPKNGKKNFNTGEEGEQGNPFLEALKNLGKSLVNTLEKLMLPKEIFDNIVTNYSRQNIEAALAVAGKIIGAESASNTMLAYNKFMANPNGPGSSPSNPFPINSTLSRSDLNKFAPLAKYAKTEIESLRKFASSDEAKEYMPDTKQMREFGLAGKTKLQAEIELLEDRISSRSQQIIDTSYGLKNSLHYGLKTKVDMETGEIKLTKGYQFRSGGSVQTFEKTPLGQVMTKLGIPADTGSTGFAPVGFAAAALGMPNAKLHGGIYNAPPMYYELNLGVISEGYDSSGTLLTESRKRILKDVKKPYVAPEQPTKFKVKPTGRKNRVVGADLMNNVEVPASFKPQPKLWRKKDYQANVRASQEVKNEVLELVGTSDHYWEYLTETKRKKAQEERNIRMAEEFEKQMWVLYEQEMNKQNKLDKLTSSIKKSKDIAPEYPKNPPPEMVNGWHPEYGNRGNYYNKLDPQSAEAMPSTGNAEIDDKVRKAKKIKKILGKKA